MTALDDLLDYIFDDTKPVLYPEFEGWVRGSRRFREFATSYRSKIRSKLKSVRDEGGMMDLHAELKTAALLLTEKAFALEYEKYAALKQRGPDFTVTFKTHTHFNVEVRRIRSVEMESEEGEAHIPKLMAVLCDKVGQMPPSIVNLLWLTAEREISEVGLNGTAMTLLQLAERKTEDFFTRRGFESAADFLRRYQRLSGVVLHQSGANLLWLNPIARHKTPPGLTTALQRLERV